MKLQSKNKSVLVSFQDAAVQVDSVQDIRQASNEKN